MTGSFIYYLELLGLFLLLGVFASLAVKNINKLALILNVKPFILGALLGVVTSLPELSLGLHSTFHGVPELSIGDLFGGTIFVLGFVVGIGLILNKRVGFNGQLKSMIFEALITFIPVVLGLDGLYGLSDGLVMLVLYVFVMYYISYKNFKNIDTSGLAKIKRNSTIRIVLYSIIGIIMIMLVSRLVITVAIDLLKQINMTALALGTIIFSVGTNLPELSIMLVSWYKKIPEFSFSHLIGSAVANTLVLGILAVIKPMQFNSGFYFQMLGACIGAILLVLTISKKLGRRVGFALLGIYVIFMAVSLYYIQ
jgi:cation:H+ antiporter